MTIIGVVPFQQFCYLVPSSKGASVGETFGHNRSKPEGFQIQPVYIITLFRPITMFCGTDNILHNNLHIHIECGNIPRNIVSPNDRYYGFK